VETDDFVVAVFNVDGEFHAIEDICTHAARWMGTRSSARDTAPDSACVPARH
jgi:nitrite reductase/ring-hydroxylating ferredoxin subunit